MFDKRKLDAALALKGKKYSDIAEWLGISVVTVYRKMNGESDFYRTEMLIICENLDIENPNEIFFAKELT